jgi:hypothetical protein
MIPMRVAWASSYNAPVVSKFGVDGTGYKPQN